MAGEKNPMSGKDVVERYFLENRARLLEIAAFLDRVDRTASPEEGKADFRYRAMIKALEILLATQENRARALQLSFSDPSEEPLESAAGLKGAYGAWDGGR
jgi:hypothetical protein